MINKNVADVLVDTLVAAGVNKIYGLAGDSLNGVTDAIRPRDDFQTLLRSLSRGPEMIPPPRPVVK